MVDKLAAGDPYRLLRNELPRDHPLRPGGGYVLLARWLASHLCPIVASTTSRSTGFVVDSCQPPINFCHWN
jgi:hypothetical protein